MESFNILQGEKIKLETQLDQLKKENEELKQFLSKEPLALQALQTGYADYKKRSQVFFEMINQYKQTLEEIREIADDLILCADDISCRCCDSGATYAEKILIKIDEVIDEQNSTI